MPRSRRTRTADRAAGLSLRHGLALAVALLLGAPLWFGVPSAAVVPRKDSSRPFPCQNRPCGCMTAEACWKQCCCYTKQEKLEWARRNAVVPPPEAELGLDAAAPPETLFATGEPEAGSCCAAAEVDAPLAACPFCEAAEAEASCAAEGSASSLLGTVLAWAESWGSAPRSSCRAILSGGGAPPTAEADEESPHGWVPVWDALRCRGLGASWMGPPWAFAPPPPQAFLDDRVVERLKVFSVAASMQKAPPPAPPPKIFSSPIPSV